MKNARKWSAILAVLMSLALLISACGKSSTPTPTTPEAPKADPNAPVDGGTLTLPTFSDLTTLNPIFANDTASTDVMNFVFAWLYDVDAKANVVVDQWSLAKELPQISADNLTYTVKLKDTPKWTDGQPVTADDVVYTFKTIANPDVGSMLISGFDKMKDIKAVDAHTVQITLSEVKADFIYSLTQPIAPAHILKDVPAKELQNHPFGKDPAKTVTNGPWKWTAWTQKQSATFEADPNNFAGKPHIQTIIYKVYADQNTEIQAVVKGEVDLVGAVPVASLDVVQGKAGLKMLDQAGPVYDYLGFSFKDENFPDNYSPFKGAKTRQAITHAINRQGIVDSVLKGHGKLLNGPFLPGSWSDAGTATNWPYDVAKAKQLLAEDGWKAGSDGILVKDGHKFVFKIQFNTGNKRREAVSAIIQQNLKEVGIQADIEPMDFSALVENIINPGKFQSLLLGWQLSIDPASSESVFSSNYFPPNGQNAGWYKNTKTDDLWKKASQTTDMAKRRDFYGQIAAEMSNDLPYVFLFQQNIMPVYRDRVHFAEKDSPVLTLPGGYLFHIANWWVTQ